ncbi:hypothetical protein [Endozoicomonas sp. Mp262]|uniref:hypothetical protein n=1 Tax=Endozoicomonas sp. Mp262 TaxID=2919499 RepID=UPI0021D9E3B6
MAKQQTHTHTFHWPDHIIKYSFLTLLLIAAITTFWMATDGDLGKINDKLLARIFHK